MKVKILSEIQSITKNRSTKFGLVGGYFDLLHSGHATFLEKCRTLCDSLIVYVHNDETARNIKGPNRPLVSAYERAYLLSKLNSVDYVLLVEKVLQQNSIDQFDSYIIEQIYPSTYICVKENENSTIRIEKLKQKFANINIVGINRQSNVISTSILQEKISSGGTDLQSSEYLLRIERTNEYQYWIKKMKEYSAISNCKLAHVSAVVVCNNVEISYGINNSVTKCWCQDNDPFIDKYHHPKCLAIHAEHDAIMNAIQKGKVKQLRESTIIVEKSPCFECAKLIIKQGIKTVVYLREYTESDGRNLLIDNGISVKRYVGETA